VDHTLLYWIHKLPVHKCPYKQHYINKIAVSVKCTTKPLTWLLFYQRS